MPNKPFVIERIFHAPVARVWKAITDRDAMQEWYFNLEAFKAETGFAFSFNGGTEEKTYLHRCVVKEVIKEKKLSYTWRYEGYPGESLVSFELFAEGDKTRLVLTHSGLETFPQDNPDFDAKNFAQGWTEIIGQSLKKFIES